MASEPDLRSRLSARLLRLDSCALSDALDRLGLQGCVTGLAPLSVARRIAGSVHTVKLAAVGSGAAPAGPPRHLGTSAIEACGAGDIIVVEQRSGIDAGSWGGLLSVGAKARGVSGVIADGPVRDVDEARFLDFPLYARGATARTARGRIVEAATDGPVTIGEMVVRPGDYVLADSTAVVFVRQEDITRVLDAAEAIAAREAAMSKSIAEGVRISEVMGASYEHMLKK